MKTIAAFAVLLLSVSAYADLCANEAKFAAVGAAAGTQAAESDPDSPSFSGYPSSYYTEKLSDDLLDFDGDTPSASSKQKRALVYNVHAMSTGAVSLVATVVVQVEVKGQDHFCKIRSIQFPD